MVQRGRARRLRAHEEAGSVWIDLVSVGSNFTVPKYGSGETADAAILRAKRRWDVEQAPPPPPPPRRSP
jgi:hypothetical protein